MASIGAPHSHLRGAASIHTDAACFLPLDLADTVPPESLGVGKVVVRCRSMNRRTWLSSLGISAAGSFTGLSAKTNSGTPKQTWVVSLETFRAGHPDQMPDL